MSIGGTTDRPSLFRTSPTRREKKSRPRSTSPNQKEGLRRDGSPDSHTGKSSGGVVGVVGGVECKGEATALTWGSGAGDGGGRLGCVMEDVCG